MVLRGEFCALGSLIARRLPGHVENLIARPNESLRVAMAIEAPFHVKGVHPPGDRHLIDAPVARGTAYSFCHVDAVIEIDIIGQIVNAVPLKRCVRGDAVADRREQRNIGKDLRVTMHAGLARRHAGKARFFDRSVAVATIDAVLRDVVFVTKRHRLRERNIDIRCVRRPEDLVGGPAGAANQNQSAKNEDAGIDIRVARKDLGHEEIRFFLAKRESRLEADGDVCNRFRSIGRF
jgi:hypothetical protein